MAADASLRTEEVAVFSGFSNGFLGVLLSFFFFFFFFLGFPWKSFCCLDFQISSVVHEFFGVF